MYRNNRAGLALLEVIVAIVVLGTAGLATIAAVSETGQALSRAHSVETEIRDAAAFLEVVTLWPAGELDRRLGQQRQGPWTLYIERSIPNVYGIEIRSAALGRTLLRTSVYKRTEAVDGF